MKLSDAFKVLLSLSLVTFSSHTVYAAGGNGTGGGDAGGGNEIEAGFKAKLTNIAERALSMSPKQKEMLRFDTVTLHSTLTMPGGLRPICAIGPELVQIRALGKMAYVFNPSEKTIFLNCLNYSVTDWQRLFASEEPGAIVFFLHEGLRISPSGNLESDNDYTKSSSFTTALLAHANYERKIESFLIGMNSQITVALDPKTSGGEQNEILNGMKDILDNLPVQEKIRLIDQLIKMTNDESISKKDHQNATSFTSATIGGVLVVVSVLVNMALLELGGSRPAMALGGAAILGIAGMIVRGELKKSEIEEHTFKLRSALINYKASLMAKELLKKP